MDLIDLHSIFKDGLVISSIPNYFNNSETPIICYKCNKPIRATIFNFNKLVIDINIDSNTLDSWDCHNSNYLHPPIGFVITGNLNAIPDARVRNIISKSPIDFPPILISLNVVERSLLLQMTSVIVGVNMKMLKKKLMPWKNGNLTFLKLLILIFHFTLVIHIFYPLNLNLLFVILNEVSRIFIWTMFWFQQIKLLTMLKLFDNCLILILLSLSLLTLMSINCSLLWVRRWFSMDMVVI